MPLAFHSRPAAKFDQQYQNAERYILPFIASSVNIQNLNVLEIGCGEGGVLKPFLERGCTCLGVDPAANKLAYAHEVFHQEESEGRITFISADIYDPAIIERYKNHFDLIVLKDTIEHIYGHRKLLELIRNFLSERGVVFIAFPPWFMPFGGHQQMTDSAIGKLPYYHLLPRPVYRRLLELFGESSSRVEGLMEVVDTRLTIQYFERLLKQCRYRQVDRRFYLINPIYEFKFGLKPVKQIPVVRGLPWIRDFVTTTCYYLIQPTYT